MHLQDQTLPILILPFGNGFNYYKDLTGLIGEHRSQLALGHCVTICNSFNKEILIKADALASSSYINPDNIEGIDVLLTAMAVETLKVMQQFDCFATQCGLSWEFFEIKPLRLLIKPPNITVANANRFLNPQTHSNFLF